MPRLARHLYAVLLTPLLGAPSQAAEPVLIDWRSGSGFVAVSGPAELTWSDGALHVTASGHVAEIGPDRSAIVGPYIAGIEQNWFGADARGLFLLAQEAGDTSGTASGRESCCGVSRPGFNAGFYLAGHTDVEAVNFAVLRFDSPVKLDAMTVDDVSNHARDAWIAVGDSLPVLDGSLEELLAPYQIVNAPDLQASDGLLTTHFDLGRSFRTLVVGAAPRVHEIPGLQRHDGSTQFQLRSLAVTPVPEPAPAVMWAIGLALLAGRWHRRRADAVPRRAGRPDDPPSAPGA